MRKVILFVVVVLVLFGTVSSVKTANALEMEGGGGDSICPPDCPDSGASDCPSCDGGGHTEYSEDGQSVLPGDVQAIMDFFSGPGVKDIDGGTASWDGQHLTIDIGGVITTWEVINIGGSGSGGDPNPNDGCTTTSYACGGCACGGQPSCDRPCSWIPCGGNFTKIKTCCPPPIAPDKPTNPDPADGVADLPPIASFSFAPVTNWGRPSNCGADYHFYEWYADLDKNKVLNFDPTVEQGGDPASTSRDLVGGADYNTTYYWRVRACNGYGNCTASGYDSSDVGSDGVWQFTTGQLPGWWQARGETYKVIIANLVLTRGCEQV